MAGRGQAARDPVPVGAPQLGRLVVAEGVGVGLLGATVGAAAGLGLVALAVGALTPTLGRIAAGCAAAGVLLAAVAATAPAQLIRRLPLAQLLAQE
ncbi:MAG TPA: hypothetical protein VNV66_09320 [Pilimelia sp.]|nr:hypothetical protein [Pilimelia sp.]